MIATRTTGWRAGAAFVLSILVIASAIVLAAQGDGSTGWVDGAILFPGIPRDLAISGDAAWVSVGQTDTHAELVRVDLSTGAIAGVPESTGARSVTADSTGVWVSICARVTEQGCDGRAIARVDPISATIQARADVEGISLELAVDQGLVWASMSSPDQLSPRRAESARAEGLETRSCSKSSIDREKPVG